MARRKEWPYSSQCKNKEELSGTYDRLRTEYFTVVTRLDQIEPLVAEIENLVRHQIERMSVEECD